MAWPFPEYLRPRVRTAASLIGYGWSEERVLAQLEAKHGVYGAEAQEAINEAQRGIRFREIVQAAIERGSNVSLAQLWALQARNIWKYAYGAAPTPAQAEWAYTQPQSMMGLRVYYYGRTASGQFSGWRELTVNVPWNSKVSDLMVSITSAIESGDYMGALFGTEVLLPGSVHLELGGAALLQQNRPTMGPAP